MRKLVNNTWHMNLCKDGFYVLCIFFNNVDLNLLAIRKSVDFNIPKVLHPLVIFVFGE